jgi:AraC-like DNA-binding protein
MTSSPWPGRVLLLPGAMVYAGPLGPTSPHQHHAWQLVLAPTGIDIAGPGGPPQHFTAALIPADTEHTIASPVLDGRLVLIDPDSAHHRRLPAPLRHPDRGLHPVDGLDAPAIARLVERPLSAAWLDDLLGCWGGAAAAPPALHPGVRRVQRALAGRLDDGDRDLASLAAVAGLSEGRLVHVFREQVGLPIRPYILWLRMRRAVQTLHLGRTLTEAAHEAGFADASHLSRTFRRMFGLAPSDVAGQVEWIVPDEGPTTE